MPSLLNSTQLNSIAVRCSTLAQKAVTRFVQTLLQAQKAVTRFVQIRPYVYKSRNSLLFRQNSGDLYISSNRTISITRLLGAVFFFVCVVIVARPVSGWSVLTGERGYVLTLDSRLLWWMPWRSSVELVVYLQVHPR